MLKLARVCTVYIPAKFSQRLRSSTPNPQRVTLKLGRPASCCWFSRLIAPPGHLPLEIACCSQKKMIIVSPSLSLSLSLSLFFVRKIIQSCSCATKCCQASEFDGGKGLRVEPETSCDMKAQTAVQMDGSTNMGYVYYIYIIIYYKYIYILPRLNIFKSLNLERIASKQWTPSC